MILLNNFQSALIHRFNIDYIDLFVPHGCYVGWINNNNNNKMFLRVSQEDCHDGRGQQQEEDTGTCGYGTVTQVPFTAFNGVHARSTDLAVLGCDTLNQKYISYVN